METQKIGNLLNSSENEYSKFATKKWYVIDSETSGTYSEHIYWSQEILLLEVIIQKRYLKVPHHLENAEQK